MTDTWVPLGAERGDSPGFQGLSEGIPAWLSQSFWDWVAACFTIPARYQGGRIVEFSRFNLNLLRKAERVCRFQVNYTGTDHEKGPQWIRGSLTDVDTALRLADFLLAEGNGQTISKTLADLFEESGSAWAVGERLGRPGLVRRVPVGVQVAAEAVMQSAAHAGARLAEAWTAAFGVDPDPSRAYSLAIKAVEDAAIPVVTPHNALATLGSIIGQMNSDANWALPFGRENSSALTKDVLLDTLRMLWAGQADRHGGNPDPSLVISQAAGEQAVLWAVPLVYAFASGAAARTP